MLTLGQAARIAGVGKTTLTRAIKAGRLSATRRDDGGYAIDPSELSRAYNVTTETGSPTGYAARRATPEGETPATVRDPELETRLAAAEAELRGLRDLVAEIRESRDHWMAQAERLALAAPIAAPPPAIPASPEPRRAWWRWRSGTR